MQKLTLLCILLLFRILAFGQAPLKGSIKYDIKYDLPEKDKKQMEQFGMTMPNSSVISSNGTQATIKMMTDKGVFSEFLSTNSQVYLLDRVDKIAYKMPVQQSKEEDQKWTVTKTDEFETIVGKKCRKYVIESEDKKHKQFIWATPEYKFSNSLFNNINMRAGGQASFYNEIEGIPLKIEVGSGTNKMEMKAVSLSTTPPSESSFKLPSEYTIEDFNALAIGKMMMRGK